MTIHSQFDLATQLMDDGKVEDLRELLAEHPDLAKTCDDGNATLLIRLIDWPGHRPRSAETAQALVEAGVDVEARRDAENGTALAGALCTHEFDIVDVLLEHGADVHAPLGWMPGTNFDLADRMCQDLGKQRDEKIRRLAAGFSKVAGRKVPTQAPFGGTVTLLFASDVEAALEFYTKKLGFHVDWSYDTANGDPYIGISRGSTDFHLTNCKCEDHRHVGNAWVRVECDLIDDLFQQVKSPDVNTLSEPQNQPWGFREFDIEDADGNRLTFFGPTTDEDDA